jgi:bifunctional DNA-binding transcriptional regulator/antitoxin component of YhaV-PrlF toxin-antitoxin module
MSVNATITIDENGQIILPLELNQYLNLKSFEWLKVKIESDVIILVPPKALDEETIESLIHAGILIDTE